MAEAADTSVHRWAVATVVATFFLILAGALVTSRDAGLAVPDWPLSFGTINPPHWYAIDNVRTEHGHRLIAGTVALLTVWLGVRIRRSDATPPVRRLATVAVAMVLAQALLGGLRVLHLSVDLAMVHGWLGQAFFGVVVALATLTSPRWQQPAEGTSPAATPGGPSTDEAGLERAWWLALAAGVLVATQLVVGIVLRHLGEAARPLLGNALFYVHVGVALLVAWCVLRLRSVVRSDACARPARTSMERRTDFMAALVFAQLALGFATFAITEAMRYDRQATMLESWLPTCHVALGAALLGTAISASMHAWAARGARRAVLAVERPADVADARGVAGVG